MSNPEHHDDLMRLLNRLIEGGLEEKDEARLEQLLEDKEGRDTYRRYMGLHADLFLPSLGLPPINAEMNPPHEASPTPRAPGWKPKGLRWIGLLAVAASVLAAIALVGSEPERPADFVARVIEESGAEWSPESKKLINDGRFPAGQYKLEAGSAKLLTASGATIHLQAGSRWEWIDSKAMRLHQGEINVHAPDSAIGFRVLTPAADMVDLGTEFNVTVSASGETDLHVAHGAVVTRAIGDEGLVPLLAHDAVRFGSLHGDIASIPFDPTRFDATDSANDESVITSNSDWIPIRSDSRVVFLGDTLTDQETHLLYLAQALESRAAMQATSYALQNGRNQKRPPLFNLGIRFPLGFRDEDLEDMLTAYSPTHVILEFGSEISLGKNARSPAEFAKDMEHLIESLSSLNVECILVTGAVAEDAAPDGRARLARYNEQLVNLSRKHSLTLVDFALRMATSQHKRCFAGRGDSLTETGQRELAASLAPLFALEPSDLPKQLTLKMIPGAVTRWRYRFVDPSAPRFSSSDIEPQNSWTPLSIPQAPDAIIERMIGGPHLVSYRDRQRGFATGIFGPDDRVIEAISEVRSDESRNAWLSTGGTLWSVWVNGKQVYHREPAQWAGWHAGRERIAIKLERGNNEIVVRARNSFFVGITDRQDWSL